MIAQAAKTWNVLQFVKMVEHGMHFTELSGRHSVLERPLSEVNGRLFFS